MDVYDVDLFQYYWRGGTFFERFAMRREEGQTLKIVWRLLGHWADLWAHLAMGIVAREWVGERAALRGRLAARGHPAVSRVGREWVGRVAAVGRPLGSMAPRGG